MTIKIWTQRELNKGYIYSDKIYKRSVSFESYGLENFEKFWLSNNEVKLQMVTLRRRDKTPKDVLDYIKVRIRESKKFKQMEAEGYHTHIYLNLNKDGVDCFISR